VLINFYTDDKNDTGDSLKMAGTALSVLGYLMLVGAILGCCIGYCSNKLWREDGHNTLKWEKKWNHERT